MDVAHMGSVGRITIDELLDHKTCRNLATLKCALIVDGCCGGAKTCDCHSAQL